MKPIPVMFAGVIMGLFTFIVFALLVVWVCKMMIG
jgi:K+-transporting ATPase A subunit